MPRSGGPSGPAAQPPGGDHPDLRTVVERVEVPEGGTFVITVAGAVAVGKSFIAEGLAGILRTAGLQVAVVPTDGFLHPNVVLGERGLVARKGFPETYDLDRLDDLVDAARSGRSPLEVPVYAHERYDVAAEPRSLERPEVLIVEGVVALQRRFGDLGVYVDADVDDIERWFVERFQALVAAAVDDPASFYRVWVDLSPAEVADIARAVWDGVNLPNLVGHIEPTRALADVEIHKGPDHTIQEVRWSQP